MQSIHSLEFLIKWSIYCMELVYFVSLKINFNKNCDDCFFSDDLRFSHTRESRTVDFIATHVEQRFNIRIHFK